MGYNEYSVDFTGATPSLTVAIGDAALQTPSLGYAYGITVLTRKIPSVSVQTSLGYLIQTMRYTKQISVSISKIVKNLILACSGCDIYCGYHSIFLTLLSVFTAQNYFGGVKSVAT